MKVQPLKILGVIRDFASARKFDGGAIEVDTDLLGEGYLDSFSIIELIVILERTLGIVVDADTLLPEDFQSVQQLCGRLEEAFSTGKCRRLK